MTPNHTQHSHGGLHRLAVGFLKEEKEGAALKNVCDEAAKGTLLTLRPHVGLFNVENVERGRLH